MYQIYSETVSLNAKLLRLQSEDEFNFFKSLLYYQIFIAVKIRKIYFIFYFIKVKKYIGTNKSLVLNFTQNLFAKH
jgi:hypothetical protein